MRHKILIVSAAALFTLSSCGEDFLYKAPQGSIDQEIGRASCRERV